MTHPFSRMIEENEDATAEWMADEIIAAYSRAWQEQVPLSPQMQYLCFMRDLKEFFINDGPLKL